MAYISKVTAGGVTEAPIGATLYGTCDTAANTAAKVAIVPGFDTAIANVPEGLTVTIKFTNSNTVSSPTLAIKPSSSGTATTAKNIYMYGTTAPGTTADASWYAGSVISFTYDGAYWQMNDHLSNTTYESKAAASGGTDLSLVTTGEKYEWDNADTTVDQKLETTSTSSYPLLMSSDTYSDTNTHYTGDVLRNNSIYANPSSGAITALGWITSGNGTDTVSKLVRAWNENGYAGVMAGSSGSQTESLLGVMTKGVNESEGSYMIWRPALGTGALLTTPATYIGGYNYNNQWENFIVQGRSGHYWGTIPAVQSSNGMLEIGKHIDFHTTSGSTADNDYRISCTGSGAATYSGTWSKASSRKIKENIEDMDLDEAKEIFNLRPVKFDYKEGFGQKDQRGLIAEEVAKVLPTLVIDEVGEEGTEEWCPASVDYIGVVPYLIKIVQEQQKEIDELKKRVGV